MIYTLGNPVTYEPLFSGPCTPNKRGRTEDYEGGWVWQTPEEAALFATTRSDTKNYRVYGVQADWSLDTAPHHDGVARLVNTSELCRIEPPVAAKPLCKNCKHWDRKGRTINNDTGPEAERWCTNDVNRNKPRHAEFAFMNARRLTKGFMSCAHHEILEPHVSLDG